MQQFQRSFPQKARYAGIGYGCSIAGHLVIVLCMLFGERIDLVPDDLIPVEIVSEEVPAQPVRQSEPVAAQANSFAPAVDDVEKRAKAQLAAVNVNGVDQPRLPGHDGSDPHTNPVGSPVPQGEGELAPGEVPAASQTMVVGILGPAPPQSTAQEPGEDEHTARKEEKLQCGIAARIQLPSQPLRHQSRVLGFVTAAHAAAMRPPDQVRVDRYFNPTYIGWQQVYTLRLDSGRRVVVILPPGFTVNVGDVIQQDGAYIDPSDPCQYIPNLAVSK